MNKLTKKQREVLIKITDYINENGYSPTIRELCELTNVSSPSTAHTHLQYLVDKGYITYVPKSSRTIRIIKGLEK